LLATGKVAYAYVGISSEDLTPEIARKFGYASLRGALVDKVVPETPADRAGLRAGIRNETLNGQQVTVGGDAIVAINGEPVQTASDVVRIVAERLAPGQVAKFTIVRGKKRLVLPLRLSARTP
jgi:S1-C subfamily serine protease